MLGIEDGVRGDGELPVVRACALGVEDGVRGEAPVVRTPALEEKIAIIGLQTMDFVVI